MQTTFIMGAKAQTDHANRGMELEKRLEAMHSYYERVGAARVDKQYIKSLPVNDGKWARVIGRATVDYVGLLKGGRMVAFDAKDTHAQSIALSRLEQHQVLFLRAVRDLGGMAFVLARFALKDGTTPVFCIPIDAWRAAVIAHDAGGRYDVNGFVTTGKASINVDELPKAWEVDRYDWLSTVQRMQK